MNHRSLHQDLGPQHRVDQRRELVDHPRLRPPVRRPARRVAGPGADRYLRTALRSSPVSRATSDRLIAPDSNRLRKRRNSNHRCGSRTIADRLPPPLTDQAAECRAAGLNASTTLPFHPYAGGDVHVYADTCHRSPGRSWGAVSSRLRLMGACVGPAGGRCRRIGPSVPRVGTRSSMPVPPTGPGRWALVRSCFCGYPGIQGCLREVVSAIVAP